MGNGREFLARRSDVTQAKEYLPGLRDVLLVEDRGFDARRLTATLRLVLGRNTRIRIADTLDKAIDAVLHSPPDMVFLDDYLEPDDSALETIPMLRRAGYERPILVISGELDRQREIALRKAGADEAIHKDNVDSVNVGEALVRLFARDG